MKPGWVSCVIYIKFQLKNEAIDWMNWATWSSLGVLFLLVTNLIVIHHDDKDKEDNIIFDVKGNHGHNIMPGVCQNKLKQKVKLSLVSLQIV